ncbi:MAG: hypothetical protein WBG86_12490, partial [Polyangiales bacterium]
LHRGSILPQEGGTEFGDGLKFFSYHFPLETKLRNFSPSRLLRSRLLRLLIFGLTAFRWCAPSVVTMQFRTSLLAVTACLLGASLGGACGGGEDAILPCTGDERRSGRAALLTAPPSLTASQIEPSDPISLAIPVNDDTRLVSAGIRRDDGSDEGRVPSISRQAATNGGETVFLSLEGAELAPAAYRVTSISLGGEGFSDGNDYIASEMDPTYLLRWYNNFEEPALRCQSDVQVLSFEVVADGQVGLP